MISSLIHTALYILTSVSEGAIAKYKNIDNIQVTLVSHKKDDGRQNTDLNTSSNKNVIQF